MQATTTVKTERPKRRRWITIGVVIALLVAGIFVVSTVLPRIQERRATFQSQTGDVVAAFTGDLSASATASGRVESSQVTGLSANSPGVVEELLVRVGDEVSAGDILAQLDTAALALQVERAQQNLLLSEANLAALLSGPEAYDVAAAEAAVLSAQAKLDELLTGPSELEIAESEANIRAQQAGVASASASYAGTLDSIKASAIAAAEADLIQAQIALNSARRENENNPNGTTHEALQEAEQDLLIAQTALEELKAGPNQGSISSAGSSLSAAAANVEQAEANHAALLAGATLAQIAGAEATLAQALANLASLTAGPSDQDIAVAEAEVEQARLALSDAEEQLAKASVAAPFDGIVTAVYVAEGEFATGPVAEIVANDLQVILSVDEIDVGALAMGQPAVITLETWPNEEIRGQVASISPSAANSGDGLVTYEVKIILDETELPVLVGMTANARLITDNRAGVLLVPNAAITADRESGAYTVNLVTGETDGVPTTEKVQVTIGLKDNAFTEITGGLSAGDQVVIGELVVPTQNFGPGGGGPFGGD